MLSAGFRVVLNLCYNDTASLGGLWAALLIRTCTFLTFPIG